tara:strand:- start:613 stop:786 length:174 start_codon:yes stop_codon:yes gene_type:complete
MILEKIFFIFICRPQAQAQAVIGDKHSLQANQEPTVQGSRPSEKAPRFETQGTGDIV